MADKANWQMRADKNKLIRSLSYYFDLPLSARSAKSAFKIFRMHEELTATETNILRMIVGGMSDREVAFALDIRENTVKTPITNVFDKIGASDRASAATLAIKRGLVRIDL